MFITREAWPLGSIWVIHQISAKYLCCMRYTKLSGIQNPVIWELSNRQYWYLAGVICTIVFVGLDKIKTNVKINVMRRVFRDCDSHGCRELGDCQAYFRVKGSSWGNLLSCIANGGQIYVHIRPGQKSLSQLESWLANIGTTVLVVSVVSSKILSMVRGWLGCRSAVFSKQLVCHDAS